MAQLDFDKAEELGNGFKEYVQTLPNAERIRLASYLLGLVNYVQQCADIDADALYHAQEETMLFDHVERDDPMPAGYHLHNMLENLADEFDTLADIVAECDTEAA